jgi:hypothetical protein
LNSIAKYLTLIFLLIFNLNAFSSEKFIFSAVLKDSLTNENLIAGSILDTNNIENFIYSDINGEFSLELDSGTYVFEVSYLGYLTKYIKIWMNKNVKKTIFLNTQNNLNEVIIQSNRIRKTAEITRTGVYSINATMLKSIPEFLGEKDILKALQLLPGVQSGNEGQRGIFVRGGSPDQNLMLYDNATVYNVAHMYNILSTFTSEALDEVALYKSYVPTKFSNRLSSVTNIQPAFGDLNKTKFHFGISPLFSNINIQTPIKKDNASININLRECHVGLFSKPISEKQFAKSSESQGGNIVYYFYDINLALQYKIKENHIMKWSFFHSQDFYTQRVVLNEIKQNISNYYQEDNKLKWYNITSSFGVESKLKNNLSVLNQFNITSYNVQYNYNLYQKYTTASYVYINNFESKSKSTIKEFSFLSDWTKKFKENLHLNFGYRSNFRFFDVNRVNQFYYDSTKTLIDVDTGAISKYKLQENYFYADLNHKINKFVEYSFGLQATLVHVNQKTFLYALPKFQLICNPISFMNIRNSITYNMQPIHLLASLQNGIQNDIWVPAIQKFKPETAWQYASGVQFNFKKQYTISVDAFYRKMYHLIEYAGSNNFISNIESWETQVVGNGTGKAYGMEFFANKFLGQFTAWAKYNLTWSNRNFSNLNAGKDFFFKFDKRHDISINLQYKMKKHFDFSLSWVYTSGLRATIPIAKYAGNSTINSYKQVDYFLYGEQN